MRQVAVPPSGAPRASLALRIGRHLGHRFALMLWAGAVLAWIGERFSPGEGIGLIAVALVAVVLINGGFRFWQDTRVERAMAAFRRMLSPHARVLRDGSELELDAAEVVAGEYEPQLRTVALTHGAHLESRNSVFSGTLVTTGTGSGIVYATGDATEIGGDADLVVRRREAATSARKPWRSPRRKAERVGTTYRYPWLARHFMGCVLVGLAAVFAVDASLRGSWDLRPFFPLHFGGRGLFMGAMNFLMWALIVSVSLIFPVVSEIAALSLASVNVDEDGVTFRRAVFVRRHYSWSDVQSVERRRYIPWPALSTGGAFVQMRDGARFVLADDLRGFEEIVTRLEQAADPGAMGRDPR